MLKKQFARLMVIGGLAVMTAGTSLAGGCNGCCWCGSPAPKAVSVSMTAPPSLFSTFLTVLSILL